jgi:IS605 OrfB family transposase
MFNVGLYAVRQHYLAQRSHLAYESVYHQTKTNDNYKLLSTDIAQQTLKVVDRSFQSFVKLTEAVRTRLYFQKVNMPYYLPKQGYFMLIIPRIRVKDGFFNVPMSPTFRKNYGEVRIPFPERLVGKTLKEVRIIPRYEARYFEVEFIIEEKATPVHLDPNKALSIDPGLDNLATCVDTSGTSFIVDGKYLKSINQWFNKENARLQSIKDKQGYKHLTKCQVRVARSRNNRVRDYLNKTARYIINYCLTRQIGKLIIGCNTGWKQEINLSKQNNQKFVQIPLYALRFKLRALCERYGIVYVEQEESYTSSASFLDQDDLPIYNADNPQDYKFSGQRIGRGLYKAKNSTLINADCNGAANILKKSNHNLDFQGVARGLLKSPLRVDLVRIPAVNR